MKGIKCKELQDEYHGINDDAMYQNFTAFPPKKNESYRMLIDKKIIKPVSVFKSRIKHMHCVKNINNGVQGGRGRGLFGGRGRGS